MNNADGVKAALRLRWPATEYVIVEEAALDTARQGRKADFVAISCWPSRGLSVDAVEVKVSYSDWVRELAKGAKADVWWRKSDRWWVACPAKLADRVEPELPDTWGLLAVDDSGPPRVVVKAANREREPLTWEQTIGLVRSAQAAGFGAMQRAEQAGYARGHEAGVETERMRTPGAKRDAHAAELAAMLDRFEKDTGVYLSDRHAVARLAAGFTRLGRMFDSGRDPSVVARELSTHAEMVDQQAKGLRTLADSIDAAFPPAVAEAS